MTFEWDEAKNRRNRVKHKISFETATCVFDDPNLLSMFDRTSEDQERWPGPDRWGHCGAGRSHISRGRRRGGCSDYIGTEGDAEGTGMV